MKPIQSYPPDEALLALESQSIGLASSVAAERLARLGRNELPAAKQTSMIMRFVRQFTHFFALLLWFAAALCFAAHVVNPESDMLPIGIAIVLVVVVNGIFSFVQEFRTEKTLETMKRLLPAKAKALRDGVVIDLEATELVVGDIVLLNEGDKLPADVRIITSEELSLNASILTGESMPVPLTEQASLKPSLQEADNVAFSGTYIVSGRGTAVVFATGANTEYGKIARSTASVQKGIGHIEQEIAYVSRVISFLALGMGLVFFLLGNMKGMNIWANCVFAIGIIVANVPEGLLPTVTMALALGAKRMANVQFLVKKLDVIENLGSVTVIATDKTGTITENKMEVKKVVSGGEVIDVTQVPDAASERTLTLCNNVSTGSEDPTDKAIYRYLESFGEVAPLRAAYTRVHEFVFDYTLKRTTTVDTHTDKQGTSVVYSCKGAFESVVNACSQMQVRNGTKTLDSALRTRLTKQHDSLARQGYRVIAFAQKTTTEVTQNRAEAEVDLIFTGMIALIDPPREGVKEAIQSCAAAGVRVMMVTGDNPLTAAAIAEQVGILGASNPNKHTHRNVFTGEQFLALNDKQRATVLSQNAVIARATPDHKLRLVEALKAMGEIVAVTGDGVNDTPALKKADVGIAMGSGTDIAREVADAIILDDHFATIVSGIQEGRTCFDNIKKFITYIMASNMAELVPFIAFFVGGMPLALTVPMVLAVDVGTDLIPALALGAEGSEAGVMTRPPRSINARLLTMDVFLRAYGFLGLLESLFSMGLFLWYLSTHGIEWTKALSLNNLSNNIDYKAAMTLAFAAIVFGQIGAGLAARSNRESLWSVGLFSNAFYLWGVAYELTLLTAIVTVPFLQHLFGTALFETWYLLYLAPLPLLIILAEEARKYYVRRRLPA
jgi:sodium/potassium-transporting ATPase subunit alpha